MNTQISRIACIVCAILLLVGIVAFIAHDRDAPVEQVRVYDLPNLKADPDGTNKTETLVSGQPTWFSDNNAAVESDEPDSTDMAPRAHAETGIEPCCPEDEAFTEITSGQDINLDHNPISPELAADMKRDAEWGAAMQAWQKRYDAHYAKAKELDEEFHALLPDDPEAFLRTGDLEALKKKLNAFKQKEDVWWEALATLEREKPVQPVHTHD